MAVEMKAPVFEEVLRSGADAEREVVGITFLGRDGKKYTLELSQSCAPLAITALIDGVGKLLSRLPENKRGPIQRLPETVSTQTAMMDDGTVSLILHLKGGVELPLEFGREALVTLRAQIDELLTLENRKGRH